MRETEVRRTEQGDEVPADAVRDFIRAGLQHDAVVEAVHDLLFEHVVGGRYHPTVVAASLQPMLAAVLDAASESDWQQIAADLIEEAREALGESGVHSADDQPRRRPWSRRR